MNRRRKTIIEEICNELEKWGGCLQVALDEEKDYYDNIPDNLQNGERACASSEAIELMETIIDSISDLKEVIS